MTAAHRRRVELYRKNLEADARRAADRFDFDDWSGYMRAIDALDFALDDQTVESRSRIRIPYRWPALDPATGSER